MIIYRKIIRIIVIIISCFLISCRKVQIIDVTFNGETHQYIEIRDYHSYNLIHWEGCPCKKNVKYETETNKNVQINF